MTRGGKQSHWNLSWYEMSNFLNKKTQLSQKSPNGRNLTWSNFAKLVEPWALPGSGLWCILIISLGGQRKSDIDRCASYRAQAHPPSHPPAPHPQEVSRNYGWISISPPSGSSDHGAESLMTNTYFLTLERGFSITETTLIITRFPRGFSSLHGLCWEFRGFLIFPCWSTKFQQFQECLRLNTFDQMKRLSEAFSFELSRRLWPPA